MILRVVLYLANEERRCDVMLHFGGNVQLYSLRARQQPRYDQSRTDDGNIGDGSEASPM